MTLWEMGSEFHLIEPPPGTPVDVAAFQGELFVNGRAALFAIVEPLLDEGTTIWLPSYVCREVYDVLAPVCPVEFYKDYPGEPAPRFDTLGANAGDIVIVQDTFGLGDHTQWQSFSTNHPEVKLVEDISHSSTPERFVKSPAHYVFSSLRKSQPVADGGIVFDSAGGLRQSSAYMHIGSHLKLEAMALKALYLDGISIEKQAFRDLQIQGERELNNVNRGGSLTHTRQMLRTLPHGELWRKWRRNTERLRGHLQDRVFSDQLKPLMPRGTDMGLFHVVIKCSAPDIRERLRGHLIANSVYPAVHWTQEHNVNDEHAVGLSQLVLTLPTDFRYGDNDIDRLAEVLREGLVDQ